MTRILFFTLALAVMLGLSARRKRRKLPLLPPHGRSMPSRKLRLLRHAKKEAVVEAHREKLWEKIKTPPLAPFHPQQPKRIELPNGMILFLQEDHELPLIDGSIMIRGGSRGASGQSRAGLAIRTGMANRWTRTRTGDQLDDFLEARAAKVETGGGSDSTSVGWSSLKMTSTMYLK